VEPNEGPCPSEAGDRLGEQRREQLVWAWIFGVLGGSMFGIRLYSFLHRSTGPTGIGPEQTSWAIAMLIFAVGLSWYARSKGRHALWGLLGFGFVFGWLALRFLPSKCGWCGRQEAWRRERCPACGAPL
jgi:hypothetical protein